MAYSFGAIAGGSLGEYDSLDREFGGYPSTMSEPEAFYAVLAAAVFADGHVDFREREELSALAYRSVALSDLSRDHPAEFEAMRERVLARFDNPHTRAEVALAVAADAAPRIVANPEMAFSAFAHALDIVMVDHQVVALEIEFIKHLAGWLRIDKEDATYAARFLRRKNRY